MEEKTIIQIRKGLSGSPYFAYTENDHFISNADFIDDIKDLWERDERKK